MDLAAAVPMKPELVGAPIHQFMASQTGVRGVFGAQQRDAL